MAGRIRQVVERAATMERSRPEAFGFNPLDSSRISSHLLTLADDWRVLIRPVQSCIHLLESSIDR